MHINNISAKTSIRNVVIPAILSLIYTIVILLIYMHSQEAAKSVSGFFSWASSTFDSLLKNNPEDPWIAWASFIIMPAAFYLALISSIISRYFALQQLNANLNLKSIDFLQGRINFNFNRAQYNFSCGFEDVKKFEMVLKSVIVRSKYSSYPALSEVYLNITLKDNKEYTIINTPLNGMRFIYSVLDYCRGIENFSYRFTGAGEPEGMREKIEDYIQTGVKQLLSTYQETNFKWVSLACFIIGVASILYFKNDIMNLKADNFIWIILMPFSFLIVVSLIFDAILAADKIREGNKINIKRHKKEDYDYGILEKISYKNILFVKLAAIAIIIFTCFQSVIFSAYDTKVLKAKNSAKFVSLKVNPLSEYNFLSKEQIYNIRKSYVQSSLFSRDNYEPNEKVFGSITSHKPWWGTITCNKLNYKGDYYERIEGPSKVSAQMNNPDALVGLSLPYLPWDSGDNKEFCTADYGKFLPISIQYSKENNLIIAKYKLTKNFLKFRASVSGRNTRYPIQLSGINALDFGYDYVYAFDTKNISMFEENNVTDDIKIFTDYIHLGGSCKYKDGCNNISPMQNDKMFTVTELPAQINLKLWKKKPSNKYMKADMYYRIQFTE